MTPTRPLDVLTGLFSRLHAEHVAYCHWKSNEHLDASMVGITDLDLLVHREVATPLAGILAELGFKRFLARPGHGYPGIEDFLGFDAPTGALTHLHIHYQLTVGEKFLKGYRLPWEEVLLSTRILDRRHQIYVADPHVELVVLVTRIALKVRARDFVFRSPRRPCPDGDALRELRWLADRIERQRLGDVARSLVGERAAEHLLALVEAPYPTFRRVLAFRRDAEPSLQAYRMYGPIEARRRRWAREVVALWEFARLRALGVPRPSPRVMPQGGILVACLGADGAGKSTVATELARWLAGDVGVLSIYGGSGEGAASPLRRVLQRVAVLARARAFRSGPGAAAPKPAPAPLTLPTQPQAATPRGLKTLGMCLWALSLARERRARASAARQARSRGMIVISDRLPQSQCAGLSDGPRLSRWLDHGPWLLRLAARWELAGIQAAAIVAPDLVFKLDVTPETARSRKPETPLDELRLKTQIVRALAYPAATRVVDIDAEQPLEQVLGAVKRATWDAI